MTLSVAQMIVVLILAISSFLSGWMLRRIQAKGREAQLQKHLTDANTTIPTLETNLRNRDQRIASLFGELTEWKSKVPSLEAAIKRSEGEALAKERELRTARVEIDALKATVAAVPDRARLAELEQLRSSLRDAQARCAELSAAVADRDTRSGSDGVPTSSVTALPDVPASESEAALATRIEMLESSNAARDAEITELHTRLDNEREAVRSVRIELDSRAAEIERAKAESAKWQARVPKLVATIKTRDSALAERDAMLAARDAEIAERATQLQALDMRIVEMSARFEAEAADHATKLAATLRLGREQLDGHQANLDRVAAERDAHSTRAQALEAELAALQTQLQEAARTAAADAQRHAAAEADFRSQADSSEQTIARTQQLAREQLAAHEQQLNRAAEQHAQIQKQLARAQEQRSNVDRRLNEARDRTQALEKRLVEANAHAAQIDQRLAAERQRHEAAVASAAKIEAARAELEVQLATARRSHREFEQHIAALNGERDAFEQRVQDAQREANERVAEDTEQQTIELVELRDEVRTLHTRIAPLESLLKQRDGALFERGEQIEAMTGQLEALVAQTESLQAALRQRGEKIATLERKLADQPSAAPVPPSERNGDDLEQQLAAQIERNRELANIVEERDRDLAAAAKSNELNGKSMMVLKQQLDDARSTEERLAAQLREFKTASQHAPEPESAAPARPAMSKPNGLFERAPEQVDELQQIRGIGDGFERGLNKLGIYRLSQLAGLSNSEITWIEAHLPTFHGRIERDDWPGQAAALMAASEHAEWSLRARNAPAVSPHIN